MARVGYGSAMPPRRIPTLAAAALIMLAAGCAKRTPDTWRSEVPSPSASVATAPATLAIGMSGSFSGIGKATTLDPKQSLLVGPHSVLQFDQTGSMDSVTGDQGDRLNLNGSNLSWPLKAPSGDEFVFVHVSRTDVQPALASGDTQSAAKAVVVVGTEVRPIANTVGPDYTVLVAAPKGATVHLRMTDGGRFQEIDMRTGTRTLSASPLLYPPLTAKVNAPTITVQRGDGSWVPIGAGGDSTAALSPYSDQHGWAPAGRAWMYLTLPFTSMDQGKTNAFTAQELGLSVSLPGGASPSGGWSNGSASELTYPQGSTGPGTNSGMSQQYIVGEFDVPDSTRSATLTIAPTLPYTSDGKTLGTPATVPLTFQA